MAMTPLTGMPDRSQAQSTFDSNANSFFSTKLPLFVTEANALQADVDAKKTLAETAATTATTQAGTATTQAGNATTQATLAQDWATKTSGAVSGGEFSAKYHAIAAAASAAGAVNSPGTQATSNTSMSIGTGSKTFILQQTGKSFAVGQWVTITKVSSPSLNSMTGAITSFNSGTGDIAVDVVNSIGSGTHTDWAICQSTQFSPNLLAIGALRFSQDVGTTFVENNCTFLRTGTIATTATYPDAANADYIKSYGVSVSHSVIASDIATNSSSVIVQVYSGGSAYVSTDGGLSYSSAALNNPVASSTSGVCWNGSRFIAAAHNGSTGIGLSYSIDGVTWTSGASTTVSGAVFTGTISVRSDGTTTLIACANGQSTWVFSTTDGTTITPIVMPAATSASPRIAVVPSKGANRWLILTHGSAAGFRSNDSAGTTWTQHNPPIAAKSVVGLSDRFVFGNGSSLYQSTTGASGSWTQIAYQVVNNHLGIASGGYGYLINAQNALSYDGTRLWIGNDIGFATNYANSVLYTTDLTTFSTWTQVQTSVVFNGLVTTSASICAIPLGTTMLFMKTFGLSSGNAGGQGSAGQSCRAATFSSGPGYVGLSAPITFNSDGTYSSTRYVGYVRVA